MQANRAILLVLSGLCVLVGLALGFLGFTGQQGVGFMGIAAALCFAMGGLGISVGLQPSPAWWVRTLLAACATIISLACGGIAVLALSDKDFGHSGELWSLHASKAALCFACGLMVALCASVGIVAHGIRVERTSDPLGPLDWGTQGKRYRTDLAEGKATPKHVVAPDAPTGASTAAAPNARFVAGHTPVAPTERTPTAALPTAATGVPDGVLPRGVRTATLGAPGRVGSRLPVFAITMVALLAIGGAGGLWFFTKGPRSASATQAPITTAQTLNFTEWGFGFDVPGAPFEQIDPAQFSHRAVLAVTRKEPALRFYVIAERRTQERTIEEAARLLREAMTDIAPSATTLLDNKAQVAGIEGWRLLTRVRVGSTDTFYCHWLGDLHGVSLQLWVVGTGRDAHSFAREADTLFDRFFVLSQAPAAAASEAATPATDAATTPEASPEPKAEPKAEPKPEAKPQAKPRPAPATRPGTNPPVRQPAQRPPAGPRPPR
jgi:hypothetical protein